MTDMRDRLSSVTFHLLQQLRKYVDDECVELVSNLGIDAEADLRTFENNLANIRSKYCSK